MTTLEQTSQMETVADVEYNKLQEGAVHGVHRLLVMRSQNLDQPGMGKYLVDSIIDLQPDQSPHERDKPLMIYIQGNAYSLLSGVAQAVRTAKLSKELGDNVTVAEVWPELLPDGKTNLAYGDEFNKPINTPGLLLGGVTVSEASTGSAADQMCRKFRTIFHPASLVGVAAYREYGGRNIEPTTYVTVLADAPVTDETYRYFTDAPRREQLAMLTAMAEPTMHHTGSTAQSKSPSQVWNGPSFAYKSRA